MNSLLKYSSMFSRKKYENNSLYEYYARKNGLQGKSLLIITCLYYTKDGITQNTICEKTYSTKQVVSAAIKTFKEKGYIYFEEQEKDRREKIVRLTEKGYLYASKILDPLREAEEKAIGQLSNDQQKLFIEYYTIFNDNMKKNIEKLVLKGEI